MPWELDAMQPRRRWVLWREAGFVARDVLAVVALLPILIFVYAPSALKTAVLWACGIY